MDDIKKAMLLSKLGRVDAPARVQPDRSNQLDSGESSAFENVLKEKDSVSSEGIQFSKHAVKRLQTRNIELSEVERTKLDDAIGSLQRKGARDSLVLMGELAFIVNVPSKTVVTALQKDQMKEQVFTNIDSTMLVDH